MLIQGSGTQIPAHLEPIIEDSYSSNSHSSETLSNSMTSTSMGDPCEYKGSLFDIVLVYVRENKVRAHLYFDPSNHIVVKTLKPIEMVMF